VLIQGDATAEDRVVSDMMADPNLVAFMQAWFARQPAGAVMSSWLWPTASALLLLAHPDLRHATAGWNAVVPNSRGTRHGGTR
jgi:hypothetical protein